MVNKSIILNTSAIFIAIFIFILCVWFVIGTQGNMCSPLTVDENCSANEFCSYENGTCSGWCNEANTTDFKCCVGESDSSPDCMGGGGENFACSMIYSSYKCVNFSCTWTPDDPEPCSGSDDLQCANITSQFVCDIDSMPLMCSWNGTDCKNQAENCTDKDGDGYAGYENCQSGSDCNDYNSNIYPNQSLENATLFPTSCSDFIDNDCDYIVDSNDAGCGGSGSAANCSSSYNCAYAQYCNNALKCSTCSTANTGDSICCNGESSTSDDCSSGATCGDNMCSPSEDSMNCPADCATGGGGTCAYNCSLCISAIECANSTYVACDWNSDAGVCQFASGFNESLCSPGRCDDTWHKWCDGNGTWVTNAYCSFCAMPEDSYCNAPCATAASGGICGSCFNQTTCEAAECTWDTSDPQRTICVPNGTALPGEGSMGDFCSNFTYSGCIMNPACEWNGYYCKAYMQFTCANDCNRCTLSGCRSRNITCAWENYSNSCIYRGGMGGGGAFYCGNGVCEYGNNESSYNCPTDCTASEYVIVCGNGMCESPAENNLNCSDCINATYYCGDNICFGNETYSSCPMDCGGGNNFCTGGCGSYTKTCSQDCGACNTKAECMGNSQCFWDSKFVDWYTGTIGMCMWGSGYGMNGSSEGCGAQTTQNACDIAKNKGYPCKWITDIYTGTQFCGMNFNGIDTNTMFGGKEQTCESLTKKTDCTTMGCMWDDTARKCWPSYGTGTETCNSACWACENEANPQVACASSTMNGGGYCEWHSDPYSPSGGWCGMKNDFMMGIMGSCDTDCWACHIPGNETKSQAKCNTSPANCAWRTDQYGGWCESAAFGSCDTNCFMCWDSNSCTTQGNTSGGSAGDCEWDQDYWMCIPQGQSGSIELCFMPGDEDNNGLADCLDPVCLNDPMCGGGMFGCTNASDCGMMSDCFMYDGWRGGDENTCEAVTGCKWEPRYQICDSAMMKNMFGAMEMGAPPIIGSDLINDAIRSANTQKFIEIYDVGMRDSPDSFGFGIMVEKIDNLSLCNSTKGGDKLTGKYYIFLDSNGIPTDNCNDTQNNFTGFEYKFEFRSYDNGSAALSNTSAYICSNKRWGGTSKIPISVKKEKGCDVNAVIIGVTKESLRTANSLSFNITKDMRIYVMAANATTNDSNPLDVAGPFYYTPGTFDFHPEDCYGVGVDKDGDGLTSDGTNCPTNASCQDPDCVSFKQYGYIRSEDCFSPQDDDGDGKVNCNDEECKYDPFACGASVGFVEDANDKTAPKVSLTKVKAYIDYAMIKFDTYEPSNGTVIFYGTDYNCTKAPINVTDPALGNAIAYDDYKMWHDVHLSNKSDEYGATITINRNTTYYFKTKNCDPSGNCAVSGCQNFTTPVKDANVSVGFQWTPPENNPFLNGMGFYFDFGGGYEKKAFSGANESWPKQTDAKMKFASSNSTVPWSIEFNGISFTSKLVNINMSGNIKVTNNTATGKTVVGIENFAQFSDLGVRNITITIPEPGDSLLKCNSSGENCYDVTAHATFVDGNATSSTWIIYPTPSLGFSYYSTTSGNVTLTADARGYSCFPNCTVLINISNANASLAVSSYNITIYNIESSNDGNITFQLWEYNGSAWIGNWTKQSDNDTFNYTTHAFNTLAQRSNTPYQFKLNITTLTNVSTTWNFTFSIDNTTVNLNYSLTNIVLDSIAPTVSAISASSITSTSATLDVTTNENSTCKYSQTDAAYASMSDSLTANSAGTSHSAPLSGLSVSTGYTYYVRCQDIYSNAMLSSSTVSFTTSAAATTTTGGGGAGGIGYILAKKKTTVTAFDLIDIIRKFYEGSSTLTSFDIIDKIREFYETQ